MITCTLLAACQSEVAAGLDEAQAQEAQAVLAQAGVSATREREGEGKARRYKLIVPNGDAGRAAQVLRAQGLPRTAEKGFAELYGSPGMIPSPTEEHARYLKALSGEIAAQLERLGGVADASVIVTAPLADPLAPFDAPRGKPTAAVLLTLRAGAAAPAEDDVKRLVAGAVEGLALADVAVVSHALPAAPEPVAVTTSLLGIHVARGSKGALTGLLAAALALVAVMGAWVVLGTRKRV